MARQGIALRTARATNHPRATLRAGYADVDLKQALREGIIQGPRLLASTKAIVATGTYAPKGFAPEWHVPQGAEEADGRGLPEERRR